MKATKPKWGHPWQRPQQNGNRFRIKVGTNWVSFDTFDEANKESEERFWERKRESLDKRIDDGEKLKSMDTRLAVKEYIEGLVAQNKKPNYTRRLGYNLLPILDIPKVDGISPVRMNKILSQNLELKTKCKFLVKETKAFLRWCRDIGGYRIDEKMLKMKTPIVDEVSIRLLTKDEVDKLIASAMKDSDEQQLINRIGMTRCGLMMEFLSKFGLRPTELISLKVKDLDFQSTILTLTPAITKTRRGRSFPITAKYVELIKKCGVDLDNQQAPLFVNRDGKIWNWWTMDQFAKKHAEAAQLGDFNLYLLRHYAANTIFSKCQDWKMVCDIMGHGIKIAFTVYQQRTKDAMLKLAESL